MYNYKFYPKTPPRKNRMSHRLNRTHLMAKAYNLPEELLENIFMYLTKPTPDTKSMKSLSLVSRTFKRIVEPFMYRDIRACFSMDSRSVFGNGCELQKVLAKDEEFLKYPKRLSLICDESVDSPSKKISFHDRVCQITTSILKNLPNIEALELRHDGYFHDAETLHSLTALKELTFEANIPFGANLLQNLFEHPSITHLKLIPHSTHLPSLATKTTHPFKADQVQSVNSFMVASLLDLQILTLVDSAKDVSRITFECMNNYDKLMRQPTFRRLEFCLPHLSDARYVVRMNDADSWDQPLELGYSRVTWSSQIRPLRAHYFIFCYLRDTDHKEYMEPLESMVATSQVLRTMLVSTISVEAKCMFQSRDIRYLTCKNEGFNTLTHESRFRAVMS
ncbi:hypothetical protein BS50DRAFT_593532 [Corynespora cassiicola Philippines]|uniref:F-box domain-containing protein n=1 Tax=Corynespora cassiicola Philippines TaxID=1448308 RepID=A0A2T2N5Z7_CORCC|nr:hypothetical protein BS50DRAFT_593532 [Corynespora cassiicola Philippines]